MMSRLSLGLKKSMLILYWLLVALMVIGIIRAVVPGIPGTSLILMPLLFGELFRFSW